MIRRNLLLLVPLAAALAFGACGATESDSESPSSRAHTMVAEGATLLDVRTPGEYSSGHVEGAVNVPISELGARLSEIPEDQAVVVYCLSGGRSASAASTLEGRGYEVLDLGAMSNW